MSELRAFVKHMWDECHDGGNFEKTQWAAKLDGLLTSHDPVEHFWTAVERGWDIEPRSYFEEKSVAMGFKSSIEMAVHHMWKRHAKDWPLAGPVDASGERQELKARFCEEMRRVVATRAFGAQIALSHTALVELVGIAAANLLDQFIAAAAAVPSSPAQEPCGDCGLPITDGQETSTVCPGDAPSYRVHRRCGKLGTVHGRVVALPPSSPVADSPTLRRLIEEWRQHSADTRSQLSKPFRNALNICADELDTALSAPSPSAGAIYPPYVDPEWLPETKMDCYRAGWEAAKGQK